MKDVVELHNQVNRFDGGKGKWRIAAALCVVSACSATMAMGATVNVRDFGAKGDGTTDDGPAILQALQSLDTQGGGTLNLSAGTYAHSDVIAVHSKVLIVGAGAGQTTLLARSASASALEFRDATDCGVKALRIEGSATDRRQNDESVGILLFNARQCTVSDVTVENVAGAGILIHASREITITNNLIRNTKADGIHVVAGSSRVLVAGNRAEGTGDDSFAAVAYAKDPQTENVTIRDNVSIGSHARGVTCIGARNCVIENNTITSPTGHAIAVAFEAGYQTHHPEDAMVVGNRISGVTKQGMNSILVDGATNVTLRQNTIDGSNSMYVHQSAQVSVSDTKMRDGIGPGIFVRQTKGTQLINNSIQRSSGSGIVLDHVQTAEVSRNTLTDVKSNGNENAGDVDVIESGEVKGSHNVSVRSAGPDPTNAQKRKVVTQSAGSHVEVESQ